MGLVEAGKRGFSVLALLTGVCLTASCVSTPPPSAGADWRALRRIDLPAELIRATWSEDSFLGAGHPMQFGRTSVTMQSSGDARTTVKTPRGAAEGLLIENLTCYNVVRGERKCVLLLDPPNSCHLFVYAESTAFRSEDFDVACPAYLALGR